MFGLLGEATGLNRKTGFSLFDREKKPRESAFTQGQSPRDRSMMYGQRGAGSRSLGRGM